MLRKLLWLFAGLLLALTFIVAILFAVNKRSHDYELAFAKEIASQLGGTVRIESRPPKWASWNESIALSTSFNRVVAVDVQNADNPSMQEISALPWLEELRFRECTEIDDNVARELRGRPHLRVLNLTDSPVTTNVDVLSGLTSLTNLTLYNSSGGENLVRNAVTLPRLVEIDLGSTLADDRDCALLAKVPTLEVVGLGRTLVTDSGVAALGKCRRLRSLTLSETLVTDNCLRSLRAVELLQEVFLDKSSVSEKAILEFRASRPQVRLVLRE